MICKRSTYLIVSFLLAMPFLAVGAPAAQYQRGGQRGPMGGGRRGPISPDDRLKQMTKEFNLTADQQAKIKPILADGQKKMEDLRNDSSGDRQGMRSQMMKIRRDSSSQIRALLDDTQKEMFDKRGERMQNRRRGGPGGPGGDNPGTSPQNN